MKRAQIPSVKQPVGLLRQDGKRPDGTTIYHGRGESCWHGTSQSRTRMPTPTSATQLWKQEPQPALPPPTRPTNTDAQIFTPVAIETAGIWHHQAVELDQELGRRATIITGDSRDHLHVPAVISGFAKGERGLVSGHVQSRLA